THTCRNLVNHSLFSNHNLPFLSLAAASLVLTTSTNFSQLRSVLAHPSANLSFLPSLLLPSIMFPLPDNSTPYSQLELARLKKNPLLPIGRHSILVTSTPNCSTAFENL